MTIKLMTQRTTSTILTNIAADLADNTSQDISPQDIRDIVSDIVDSMLHSEITSSGTHSGALVIDMNFPVQVLDIDGNVPNMTTDNRDSTFAKACKVHISGAGGNFGLEFSSQWQWLGTQPSGIMSGQTGLLTLTTRANENQTIAAMEILGTGG